MGYNITVPVSYIDECYPWVEFGEYGEEESALLRLRATLLDLHPLEQKGPPLGVKDDVIRIWIQGYSLEKASYINPTASPKKFTGFEKRIDPESYTNAKDNAKYFTYSDIKYFEPTKKEPYGLKEYKSVEPTRGSTLYQGNVIYVKEKNPEEDEFVLACENRRDYDCGCKATVERPEKNIKYGYCYTQKNLRNAEKIHENVKQLVDSFFAEGKR